MTRCSSLASDSGIWPSSIWVVSRTLNTSTEWCAVRARPDSVTMSGCGTLLALQASATWLTMSDAYSCSV